MVPWDWAACPLTSSFGSVAIVIGVSTLSSSPAGGSFGPNLPSVSSTMMAIWPSMLSYMASTVAIDDFIMLSHSIDGSGFSGSFMKFLFMGEFSYELIKLSSWLLVVPISIYYRLVSPLTYKSRLSLIFFFCACFELAKPSLIMSSSSSVSTSLTE